jgi:uncharacterized protein YceH (UPF0502 family)
MELIPIHGHDGLYKDITSGAVICINKDEALSARERKQRRAQKELQQQQLNDRVDQLSDEISEIKSLLTQLLEKI